MQVFKTFFKISRKYIATTICFAVVFLIITISLANQQTNSTVDDFKNYNLDIAIFDHDNSSLSKALYKYLEEKHNIVDIDEDLDTIRDNLYTRKVNYVLIIPEGFFSNLENIENISDATTLLDSYKISSYAGYFADMQINKFVSTYLIYAKTTSDSSIAYENTLKTIDTEVDVTIKSESKSDDIGFIYSFYQYLPYIFISSIVSAIAPIIIAFNKTEMKRRSFCSSISPTKYNLSIIIASSVFTSAIALLYIFTSIYFDADTILSINGLLLVVNAILAAITALGFGYLFAQLTDSMNIISALSNIFGLGSSFLCGIFVPRELLGEGVSIIGKFFPAYWYINVNEALAYTSEDANRTIVTGLTIQLLFIIAIFILGMVANRLKNKK